MTLDIGFSVEYTSPSGDKTMILSYKRYKLDQGNYCTIMAGNYTHLGQFIFSFL